MRFKANSLPPAFFALLFLLLPRTRAQGALSLLERARLVVEGRLLSTRDGAPSPRRILEVSRVLRGPSRIRRIRLAALEGISAHKRPLPGEEYLLFLAPLPAGSAPYRIYTVLQFPFGATALGGREGREFALHVLKLSRAFSFPARVAAELLEALESPFPNLVLSAAYDLEAHPRLLPLLGPAGGRRVLRRLLRLGPAGPWAEPLVHVVGDLRPEGWARALAEMLSSPGGAYLAPAVGQVLGKVEGARAVEILAGRRKALGEIPPAGILALGATRRPEALPILRRLLGRKENVSMALTALTYYRGWRAIRLLREELASRSWKGREGKKEGESILRALKRMGTRAARNLLARVARGDIAPELSGRAAALTR